MLEQIIAEETISLKGFIVNSGAVVEITKTRNGTEKLVNKNGAGDEVRTRNIQLGRLALYQLSYSRINQIHLIIRAV